MEPTNQPIPPAMNTQNSQYMPPVFPPSAPAPAPRGDKKVGPIIASLIIVLVLIFAALYIFASRITQPIIPDDSVTASDAAQTDTNGQGVKPVTSTSTDVNSMQADLDASTNGLDNQNF